MSASWLLLVLFSLVTGNPLAAVALTLAVLWTSDRVTLGLLPDPARALARWRRGRRLRATLLANPNDRRARLELGELLATRRPAEAAELLRLNVEAGDEDVHTAFLYGAALARSGAHERAERVLAFARELEPGFRMGEIDLELGRLRLGRGDAAGAREALERLLAARPGTVEGRWLLSRALTALGDAAAAARVRDDAWAEFRGLPRFRRRQDRRFAWRMRPVRGVAAFAAVLAAVTVGALLVAGVAIAAMPGPPAECGGIRRGSAEVTAGRQRMTVGYFHRDGRVTHLLAHANRDRAETPPSEAETQEMLRVMRTPRDPGRVYATVIERARYTVFPIEMGSADVERLDGRTMASTDELIAYLRRFEVSAAAP